VRITGDAHGFGITSTRHNADGTVTAVGRNAKGSSFTYTGTAGAAISLVMRVPKGSKTGKPMPMIGVVTDPAASKAAVAAAESDARLSATRAVVSPASTYIGHWCITYTDGSIGWEKSCDLRWLLAKSGDYLIADEIGTWAESYGSTPLTHADIENDYASSSDTVVKVEPSSSLSHGCSTYTLSFTLYGLGFSTDFDSCDGTIYPYGLADDYGGSYYSGSTYDEITMEPTLEVGATSSDPGFTTYFGINGSEYGVTW
jgi:hypothetical protein